MSLPPDYLTYGKRRYGMDHDRYEWSMLPKRKPVSWPNGARVALLIAPALEWFPLDMKGKPFNPPGGLTTAYPDFRHYTLRDYGNRVGIFRIMRELERRGVTATAFINGAVAARYPSLLRECADRGWEIAANGLDMDHLHHGGLDRAAEAEIVRRAVSGFAGRKLRGWLSPAKSESFATLDLVAEAGFDYVADWTNDDMPYAMKTSAGTIHAMPISGDVDDYAILIQNHHTEDAFAQQVIDQFDVLYAESGKSGGRIMTLAIRPWITGQPYRIGSFEKVLDHMLRHRGVWPATAAQILDAWKAQQ